MNGRQAKAIRKEARKAVESAMPTRRGKAELLGRELDAWSARAGTETQYSVRRHPLRRKRTVVVVYRAGGA